MGEKPFSSRRKTPKEERLLGGLAMVGSAAKPQTKQKLVFCAGPSEQRAAGRSADERSEAEAPKQAFNPQANITTVYRFAILLYAHPKRLALNDRDKAHFLFAISVQ